MSALLLLCFVISGFADAMFGIAAVRQFSVAFGSTPIALCLCFGVSLAAFTAGAYWSARLKHPSRNFALLHFAIGILIPAGIAALTLFHWLAPLALPAIVLIGAEPAILFSTANLRRVPGDLISRIVGLAFALKLIGVAAGLFAGGFLPFPGLYGVLLLSAACHLAIAASRSRSIFIRPDLTFFPITGRIDRSTSILLALAGFLLAHSAAIWTRSIEPAAGTSARSFASTAAVICFGLACGFALSAWRAPTARYPGLSLALVGLLTTAATFAAMFALPHIPRWQVLFFRDAGAASPTLVSAIVLLPVSILLGAISPLALRCIEGEHRLPQLTGWGCAVASGAAAIGAILFGAILVPFTTLRGGLWIDMMAAAIIAAIGAAWLTAWSPRQRVAAALVPIALAIAAVIESPDWDPRTFATSAYSSAASISDAGPETFFDAMRRMSLDFYKEGAGSTIAVTSSPEQRLLWIDGHLEEDAAITQPLLFEVPFVLGRPLRDAFVAGIGSGAVANALAARAAGAIHVAERESGVIEAAASLNPALFSNPRVRVRNSDPRAALAAAPAASYDLIASNLFSTWAPAAARLTTREFYRTAADRLRPAGILVQRIPISRLDFGTLQSLLKTFTGAFPHALVLTAGRNATDLILFGSSQPLALDWLALQQVVARSRIVPGTLISRILMGDVEARTLAAVARENSDQNGAIEFDTLKNLYLDLSADNWAQLSARGVDPWKYVSGAPPLEQRVPVLAEMSAAALLTNDLQRGIRYTEQLRKAGDEYDADRLQGNLLYELDRREDAVALWMKCERKKPGDALVVGMLVNYYQLMQPSQRPKEYEDWLQIVERQPR